MGLRSEKCPSVQFIIGDSFLPCDYGRVIRTEPPCRKVGKGGLVRDKRSMGWR